MGPVVGMVEAETALEVAGAPREDDCAAGVGPARGPGWRRWWRGRRRLDRRQQRAALAQPGDGQLGAAARLGAVVAFVDEPGARAAEVLDAEPLVAERVGNIFDPPQLRGCGKAGDQLDAATAVEARAYFVVLHLTPLSGKGGSH